MAPKIIGLYWLYAEFAHRAFFCDDLQNAWGLFYFSSLKYLDSRFRGNDKMQALGKCKNSNYTKTCLPIFERSHNLDKHFFIPCFPLLIQSSTLNQHNNNHKFAIPKGGRVEPCPQHMAGSKHCSSMQEHGANP